MSMLIDFIRESIEPQHTQWDDAVSDLTPEQMHYRPNAGNHIGFIVWHYVRTEDNVVQFIFQNRKPTVWVQGGYDQAFGLPRTAQGTGMPAEEAFRLRLPPAEQWMAYQRAVWQATDGWLASATEEELQRQVRILPFGEIPIQRAVRQILIGHGFMHLGQVYHLRTLQGLQSTGM